MGGFDEEEWTVDLMSLSQFERRFGSLPQDESCGRQRRNPKGFVITRPGIHSNEGLRVVRKPSKSSRWMNPAADKEETRRVLSLHAPEFIPGQRSQ
jgi:hypothetical protein